MQILGWVALSVAGEAVLTFVVIRLLRAAGSGLRTLPQSDGGAAEVVDLRERARSKAARAAQATPVARSGEEPPLAADPGGASGSVLP